MPRRHDGLHAHLPPGGPGRIDDVEPTARPGVPMEHAPEPFPTAPERVVVQRPRVEVLQIPGRKKPAWVVSNAQPPRGLAGRLRRTGVPHSRAPPRALDAAARRRPARGAAHPCEAVARLRRGSRSRSGRSSARSRSVDDSGSDTTLPQERGQRASLVRTRAPRAPERWPGPPAGAVCRNHRDARRGQLHPTPASVARIRSPGGEALPLQLVQLSRHAGRVLCRCVGQLALGERAQLGEPIDQAPGDDRLTARGQRTGRGDPQPASRLAHQPYQLRRRAVGSCSCLTAASLRRS